jgi:hypothetical protein
MECKNHPSVTAVDHCAGCAEAHRQEVNALPSLYPALCKIGLGVAIAQAVALVVLGLLYSVVRGS